MESLIDIALQPEYPEKKLVLHPGTIRTVEIPFIHRGAIEGTLNNEKGIRMFGYKIAALDKEGKEQVFTYADIEGFFILDNIPYGSYTLIVSKDDNILAELQDITVDAEVIYIPDKIMLDWKGAQFFEDEDSKKELNNLEEKHEKGFNNDEYLNNTFPIAIPHDEKYEIKKADHPSSEILQIEDIEGDIFADDNSSDVLPAEINSLQDIEALIFGH